MKSLFFASIALLASAATASAITVVTPANGAQVKSPFTLTASTTTCGSVPAASMGYSIDHDAATIEPTSFTAQVVASPGPHVLHVKCWGTKTSSEILLNVTVSALTTDIVISSPANGATLISPFNVVASATNCGTVPAASMGYSIDGGSTTMEPLSFSASVKANPGWHVLHVKCFASGVTDQVQYNIHVVPPPTAATPVFSLVPGTYTSKQVVSLYDATPGATIYYTVDGSAPTASSLIYSGPITMNATTTIETLAAASGYTNSGLARADYVISLPKSATIPDNAIKLSGVQLLPGWRIKHDPATPGDSTGAMTVVSDPSLSGQAQRFDTSFTNSGGELYSLSYGNDANAKNFVYDGHVWIASGSSIMNLEMDNNQVMPNGDTVIYAFQCSGYTGVWEYSANVGTQTSPIIKWLQSTVPCNPNNWTRDTWHHVQIQYSRDDNGNVTYQSVWFDGVQGDINQTVNSSFTLGWADGVLVTNFQVDGYGTSGASTLYLDNLTIYRW